MGFSPPLKKWLCERNNQKWAIDHLCKKESLVNKYFSNKSIRKLFDDQNRGFNNTLRIWRLLFLNKWFDEVYY